MIERRPAKPSRQLHGKGSEEQEADSSSRAAPQLVDRQSEATNGEGSREEGREDSTLRPRKSFSTEGGRAGSVADVQEPRKPPDDTDGDCLPLEIARHGDDDKNHDKNIGSLDVDCESSFLIDDDRDWAQGVSTCRRDRARHGSLSGDHGSSSFSPQPFAITEEEPHVDGGMHEQQQHLLQSHGDRCSTRGNQQERIVRGAGLGRVKPRARSQVSFVYQRAP